LKMGKKLTHTDIINLLKEKTKRELLKSLKIGAQEMLESEIEFESEALMTTISVPGPEWVTNLEE
jgi:hypothetical protein